MNSRLSRLFLFGLLCSVSYGAESLNIHPLSGQIATAEVHKKQILLKLDLSLASPYKAYLDKFQLRVLNIENVEIGALEVSPLIEFKDVVSNEMKKGIKEGAEIQTKLTLLKSLKENTPLKLALKYQACTEKNCLFPTDLFLETELSIDPQNSQTYWERLSQLDFYSESKLFIFAAIFILGFLTSLTPCIFPMIPITLSVIGASTLNSQSRSRFKGFTLSLVYVLGIALTYATIGYAAAKTGALFGSLLSNPYVVITLALIFVVMGLSMFGLFEIQMPAFIRNHLGATKTKKGYLGAFASGLIAGIVASPCVGPVLVGVLTFVAQTQNAVLGFSLLFTFALGMGILFLALGTFSSLVSKIPRSGPWMVRIKSLFGVVMILIAFYYLYPLLQRTVMPTQLHKTSQKNIGDWREFNEEEFEKSLAQGKSVVLDFYADWCVACKELEKFTFPKPDVQREFLRFHLYRVDATLENELNSRYRKNFQVMGLPTMLFFSKGKLIKEQTLTGFESADDFLRRLRKID